MAEPEQQRLSLAPVFEIAGENFREFELEEGTQITGRPCASLHFPWHRIRTEAGLSDVRLHDLRHTFASVLVNEGKQLYRVQRLLGHANAKATQRYAHLAPEALADAAEAMGNVVSPILKRASNSRSEPISDLRPNISERDKR